MKRSYSDIIAKLSGLSQYIITIFCCEQALNRGVIYRSIGDVASSASPGELRKACEILGFQLLAFEQYYLILCSACDPKRLYSPPAASE